ncbi:MAG: hypothetical protein ACLS9K_08120 [Lachnospira eligens]
MKHFIRLRLKNLTAIGLSLCMAATFAVPFFAYPDQLMADTRMTSTLLINSLKN